MEIRIRSYIAASFLMEQEPGQWDALVILDSSASEATDFLKSHTRSYLCLRFDDVEEARSNKLSPSRVLVEQGLAFAKGKDKLIVSCRAGRGRSVAMAYAIACRERGSAEAIKLLDPTRHRPNRLVVKMADAILNTPDTLDQFDAWRRCHADVRLSDYYEELERELDALEAQGASNKICPIG